MSTPLDLGSLEPAFRQVTIDGKVYTVSEASEPAGVAFKNAVACSFRYELDEDGRRRPVGYAEKSNDMEFALVRACVIPDLPENVTYRTMKQLYMIVEELNPHLYKDVPLPNG